MSKADENEFDLESFDSPDVDESESDSNRIDLDPGESITGQITDVNLGAGDHGLIEIDGQTLWLNYTMRRQLESALIQGQPIAHVKLEDEESFENDDGEEQTYNPRELRFKTNDN